MKNKPDILIVEDSPTQALELRALVEACDCNVRVARDGAEALRQIADTLPVAVITDVVMPEMDGYTLCRTLKNDPRTAGIPVMLVTSLNDPHDVMRGIAAGADNFLIKPFNEDELLSRIRYLLANLELRKRNRGQMGVEIMLEGERHFITAERQQILDLLISTYEQGIRLNQQLRQKHDELAQSNRLLDRLFEFTGILSDARTEKAVIERTLDWLPGFPGVSEAWLLLLDKKRMEGAEPGRRLRMAGFCGQDREKLLNRADVCLGGCPSLDAVVNGADAAYNVAHCPTLQFSPGGIHACVPLAAHGEPIGVLNIVQANATAWPAAALGALGSIGRTLAMALTRARLFELMEQRIHERTLALVQSESLLRDILQHLPVGVLVTGRDGDVVISNGESERILGRAPQDRSADRVLPADDWSILSAALNGLPTLNHEHDITGIDGVRRALQTSVVPLYDEPEGIRGAIAVFQDITERRQRDLDMRIRNRAIEASHNAIIITDHDQPGDPIIYVNPAFQRITGYSLDDVLGRDCGLLVGDDIGQVGLGNIQRALREETVGAAILTTYRKDGSRFWSDLWISPVVTDRGAVSHFVTVLRDITDEKRYQEELEHQANHDGVTGLPNRNLLRDRLQHAIAYAGQANGSLAVAFLDIDQFKAINETLGHDAGDQLLRAIAERLNNGAREVDTVARLGGDEFVIVMPDFGHSVDLSIRLERMMAAVAEPLLIGREEIVVTCSIGVCCFPMDGDSVEVLLRNADTAMFQAKSAGRNRFCAFTAEMNEQMQKRVVMERKIRQALQADEFFVVYQPQLDFASNRLCGFEALVRWRSDNRVIPPDEFIAVAEQTGQIIALDHYVLGVVCAQLSHWLSVAPDITVAANISAITLMDSRFVERMEDMIRRHAIAPMHLTLEVTESTLMTNVEEALAKMNALVALGVTFSIDDFGTGYSSLAYVKRFPFRQLKIDRSFINDLDVDASSASLVRSIISIGKNLGTRVIAEGVETPAQLTFLREAGCDEVQGYHYSRPLPPDQCELFLRADITGNGDKQDDIGPSPLRAPN